MTYSLWRDGRQLGDIVLALPASDPNDVAGVFAPTDAFSDLAPVMQVRLVGLPGYPVLQTPITHTRSSGPVALQPMSEAQAAGVPTDQLFEVRDASGIALVHRMIALDRLPPVPEGHIDAVREACRAADVPYSQWYLHAAGELDAVAGDD